MKTIKPAEPPSEPPHEIQKEEIKVYLDKDGVYRINGNNVFKKNGEINRTIYRQYRKQIDKFLKENNMENKIPKDEISTLNIIEEEPKPASVPEPEPEPVPEQSLTEQLKNKVGVKAKLGRINIFNKDGTISGQFLKNRKALEYVESNLGIKFNTNDEMKQAFGYSSKPRSKKVNKADNETIAEAEKYLNRTNESEGFNISVLDKLHKKYAKYVKPKEFDAIIYTKMKKRYPDLSKEELDKKFIKILKDYDRVNRPSKYEKRLSNNKYDNYTASGIFTALLPLVPSIITGIKSLFSKGKNPDALEPTLYKGDGCSKGSNKEEVNSSDDEKEKKKKKYKKQFRGCAVMSLSDLNSIKNSIK